MATRLKKLSLNELSLVRRGANPGARVLFYKSKEPPMASLNGFVTSLRTALRTLATGKTADGTILKSDEDVLAVVDEEVDAIAASLNKAEKKKKPNLDDAEDEIDGGADEDTEDPTKKEFTMPDQEAVQKAIDEAVAKARAEVEAIQKRADAAEARLTKMEDEKATETAVAKAKAMLGDLPGDAVALGGVLKKLSPEETAVIDKAFTGARTVFADAKMLESIGNRVRGGAPSAGAKLESAAEELRKINPKMTKAQAISKALDINPALYDADTK